MEIDQILETFEYPPEGEFPRAAVAAALTRREEILPHLLGILEKLLADPTPYVEDEERADHLIALCLLARFRETRAYPLLLRIMSLDEGAEALEAAGGRLLGNILASLSAGDSEELMKLAGDPAVDSSMRGSALHALVTQVAAGRLSRDEAMRFLAGLIPTLPRDEFELLWLDVGFCCLDLCPVEVYPELKAALDEDILDPFAVDIEDMEERIELGIPYALERLNARGYRLVDDVERELTELERFAPEEEVDAVPPYEDPFDDDEDDDEFEGIPETYERQGPKIGRNQPCPCGSGRKYKKCCGK